MHKRTRDQIELLDHQVASAVGVFRKFVEGTYSIDQLGIEHDVALLNSIFAGSIDYYNLKVVGNNWNARHPLSMVYIEDKTNKGFVDADLEHYAINDDTIAIKSDDTDVWDINQPPPLPFICQATYGAAPVSTLTYLLTDYPAWNGWPIIDDNLDGYPSYTAFRIPVFYFGQYFSVTNKDTMTSMNYDHLVEIDGSYIIPSSLWTTDYRDIRIFRCTTYDDNLPMVADPVSDTLEELPIEVDTTTNIIRFPLSIDNGASLTYNQGFIYIVYWGSPDAEIGTLSFAPPIYAGGTTWAGTDPEITTGRYHNYFYQIRTDMLQYKTEPCFLKSRNTTNYHGNENSAELYNPRDPVFYDLFKLRGTLDASIDTDLTQSIITIANDGEPGNVTEYFSVNIRDDNGVYPNPESVIGILVSAKPYSHLSSSENEPPHQQTTYDISYGPEVMPDFYPADWSDFTYYPNLPKDHIPIAQLIISQNSIKCRAQNTARAHILHLKYNESYGRNLLESADFSIIMNDLIDRLDARVGDINNTAIVANTIYSAYMPILAKEVDDIDSSFADHEIVSSHIKYAAGGDSSATDVQIPMLKPSRLFNFGVEDISLEFITQERALGLVYSQPWFKQLVYWSKPIYHDTDPFDFTNDTNWLVGYSRGIDTSRQFIRYIPGDGDYDDTITAYDPTDPTTILQDRDNCLKSGLLLTDNECIGASTLELYFPEIASTDDSTQLLNVDYTMKFVFRDFMNNYIDKDIFVTNANYYISDADYNTKETNNQSTLGYITPTSLMDNKEYNLYGVASIIPNVRTGNSYKIRMRVFDPDDPLLPTYDEMLAELKLQYADALAAGGAVAREAWADISEALRVQREDGGGFDIVDLRTINDRVKNLDEFWMGISNYSADTPVWQKKIGYLSGTTEIDPDTGLPIIQTRYGYKVNDTWYYQNFDQDIAIEDRLAYVATHFISTTENLSYRVKSQTHTETYNIDFELNYGTRFLSQSFSSDFLTYATKIQRFDLYLSRSNIQQGSLTLYIFNANIDGEPIGAPIGNSIEIPITDVALDGGWVNFIFENTLLFETLSNYCMVLYYNGITDDITDGLGVKWYYSDTVRIQYCETPYIAYLAEDAAMGDEIVVVDDASVFPSPPFLIEIDNDIYSVIDVVNDTLFIAEYEIDNYEGVIKRDLNIGISVQQVVASTGPYVRRNLDRYSTGYYSGWAIPTEAAQPAGFRMFAEGQIVSPILTVQSMDWFGSDLTISGDLYNDAFYVVSESNVYDITKFASSSASSEQPNTYTPMDSSPLGGFNVAGNKEFPRQNNVRAEANYQVDGYWAFSTLRLEQPEKIKILPSAISYNGSVEYLPFRTNMFVTAGLVRDNGTRKVVNKILFGYNSDYGTIAQSKDAFGVPCTENAVKLQLTSTVGAFTDDQWVYHKIRILDGPAAGNELYIVDTYGGNEVEVITAINIAPEIGDSYVILFTQEVSYSTGTITNTPALQVDNTIIIQDNTKVWTNDEWIGYTLWIIDGNTPDFSVTIISNTSTELVVSGSTFVRMPSNAARFAIIAVDEAQQGVYGIDVENLDSSPIYLDSEKFIGIDHLHISSIGFPVNYWDGRDPHDAFIVRGVIDVTE